jgi:MFS family permease
VACLRHAAAVPDDDDAPEPSLPAVRSRAAWPHPTPNPTPHPRAAVLIACRALEGVAAAGLLVTGNAFLADIYEPAQRGKWMGFTSVPALIGEWVDGLTSWAGWGI